MALITIDTDSINGALGGAAAVAGTLYGFLKYKGYIEIWKTKLIEVPTSIAVAVKHQNNETALTKLQMPDDVLCVLNSFEINSMGKVVLKGQGRVNTLLNLSRPLTDSEKDEVIKIFKNVLVDCKK